VAAAVRRKADSQLMDGESIVYRRQRDAELRPATPLRARQGSLTSRVDPVELNGTEVRKQPLVERDGNTIFEHVCRLGHEGIVAKRTDHVYESGR